MKLREFDVKLIKKTVTYHMHVVAAVFCGGAVVLFGFRVRGRLVAAVSCCFLFGFSFDFFFFVFLNGGSCWLVVGVWIS